MQQKFLMYAKVCIMEVFGSTTLVWNPKSQTFLRLKFRIFVLIWHPNKTNAAFIHNGFDNQVWNLVFVKMDFQVLKLKFHACNFKWAFYSLHKLYTACPWLHKITFIQAFLSVPGCQTYMCKRGISYTIACTWTLFYRNFCHFLTSL